MDKFPEAFNRFERDVDLSHIKTFGQLTLEFMMWGKERATLSKKQTLALKIEANERKIGYLLPFTDMWGNTRFRNARTGKFARKEEYEDLI